ncbi:MAG: hypothetical protein CMB53_01195 [Euryarchaeota archaeon]|nr:hypothetical protein [Euryarchaeota archaeon]|tara:strand:- start:3080 stop:3295 length:216 start_codon:yes stop_codon:yes gene_type:complete
MAIPTETLLQAILSLTALALLWLIFKRNYLGHTDDEEEYSGLARDPESLSEPTPEALSELDRLIDNRSDNR